MRRYKKEIEGKFQCKIIVSKVSAETQANNRRWAEYKKKPVAVFD